MRETQMYGYVRVSSKDQNEDRQLLALDTYSVPPENIYTDKQSGKDFERPAYMELIQILKADDLIVIKSIDRLGRNYEEIISQWRYITKTIGADIVILDMPLLDTRREKDLLGTFISDLVLQVLSFVSQTEREYIKQRQAEGILAARKRGTRFGRPPCPIHKDFKDMLLLWENGAISSRKAAEACGVSQSTFLKWKSRTAFEQKKTRNF